MPKNGQFYAFRQTIFELMVSYDVQSLCYRQQCTKRKRAALCGRPLGGGGGFSSGRFALGSIEPCVSQALHHTSRLSFAIGLRHLLESVNEPLFELIGFISKAS